MSHGFLFPTTHNTPKCPAVKQICIDGPSMALESRSMREDSNGYIVSSPIWLMPNFSSVKKHISVSLLQIGYSFWVLGSHFLVRYLRCALGHFRVLMGCKWNRAKSTSHLGGKSNHFLNSEMRECSFFTVSRIIGTE